MSKFVTQALWKALQKDEKALLKEFCAADEDFGNIEVKESFSEIEGEDFIGLNDFGDNFGYGSFSHILG